MMEKKGLKICALAGGVGGARMADGFYRSDHPIELTVIVNIGDDFDHFGLRICPDIDTVCYTLADLANPATGWGLRDETWMVYQHLEGLDAPTWFQLGDRDLATHLERTRLLNRGLTLSQITRRFCKIWGVDCRVLPVSDDPIPTIVHTQQGSLSFQEYFVRENCDPQVTGFEFKGVDNAKPAPGVLQAIKDADVVLICPSNPWVSIDPILMVEGVRDNIKDKQVVTISPIIGGKTVKGPAAKMYAELGIDPSAFAVAEHYQGFNMIFVLDEVDIDLKSKIEDLGATTYMSDILIKNIPDRVRLAEDIIHLIVKGKELG